MDMSRGEGVIGNHMRCFGPEIRGHEQMMSTNNRISRFQKILFYDTTYS